MFEALERVPTVALAPAVTAVEEMRRLASALGFGGRLLVKRDDTIGFAFGGNKVRKLRYVAAEAQRQHADALVTSGGVQSNHARVTAAAAVRLGMRCVLVANGSPPARPTANALLDRLLGAEVRYVATREDRASAVQQAADDLRRQGRRPFVIPVGASTPLGALGYVDAVRELLDQIAPPDVIVHATSSGGTQAGLVAGCALAAVETRVIGISADEPSAALERQIREILAGIGPLLGTEKVREGRVEVDDRFVGEGYGIPTAESRAAIELTARTDAIFLDPTYTAKAMAGLIALIRTGALTARQTVLFWHTGGQVGLFAGEP